MRKNWSFTSESVTEGHPDKICDQISDAIVDELISLDPESRIACETAVTTGMVFVFGEITSRAYCDIPRVARKVIHDIGYINNHSGFDADTCAVMTAIGEQSPDIASGVNKAFEAREGIDDSEIGAGDQGMVYGFANKDTATFMPMPIFLAHKLCRELSQLRRAKYPDIIRPDGKSQVTVRYEGDKPVHIDTAVISTQHSPDISQGELQEIIQKELLEKQLPRELFDKDSRVLVNPSGRFVVGGPQGDSGITGRKIVVDTYGGFARTGGGAFSGKDPTKVDRSAAYAARYAAKNIVAADLADSCEVSLAYAIGVARPVAIDVNTFGTGKYPDEVLAEALSELIDFRPQKLITKFKFREEKYLPVAAYGHFGRDDIDVSWEKVDLIDELRAAVDSLSK